MCVCCLLLCLIQVELDQEKGLEMRKWVLSGILASEETYLSQLEALLIVGVIMSKPSPVLITCTHKDLSSPGPELTHYLEQFQIEPAPRGTLIKQNGVGLECLSLAVVVAELPPLLPRFLWDDMNSCYQVLTLCCTINKQHNH